MQFMCEKKKSKRLHQENDSGPRRFSRSLDMLVPAIHTCLEYIFETPANSSQHRVDSWGGGHLWYVQDSRGRL